MVNTIERLIRLKNMMIIALHNIIIPKESITSSKKKLKEGFIELPLSREYKKLLKSKKCRPRIKIPENIRDKKIISSGNYSHK